MTKVLTDSRSIRIKGRSFLAMVLSPDMPLGQWLVKLDDLAARSAGFFLERPIVLDVTDLAIDRSELKGLLAELAQRNVRIMGIEGARPSLFEPGMPPAMKGGRPAADFEATQQESVAQPEPVAHQKPAAQQEKVTEEAKPAPVEKTMPEPLPMMQSIIIREPVRSGQSIIFPEGDVTIVGSVASGAEVIAGGSVHIYGALRGRALAGSLGNSSARIFCRKLEAELLAIDGIYTTADEMPTDLQGQAVQLWLEGDEIKAQKLV
ncbi:septum site-determining protein MinC [Rhizobium sp. KVB221]|uniref:Probable septum site-determining protein MinC n=1 Tax=Rhizobium setariae TaxID=2801340 RepID=A0A937CPY2_9HYPH|nr:septum site-determining protein MinC [Rhizobium setariae]